MMNKTTLSLIAIALIICFEVIMKIRKRKKGRADDGILWR